MEDRLNGGKPALAAFKNWEQSCIASCFMVISNWECKHVIESDSQKNLISGMSR